MKLTISIESSAQIIAVDIPGSLTLEDFKAYLQAETDIEPNKQIIKLDGKTLVDLDKTLQELGIKEDDLIVLSNKASSNPTTGSSPSQSEAQIEFMRQQFLNNPQANSQLRLSNPHLHSILNNPTEFKNAMLDQLQQFQNGYSPHVISPEQQQELRRLQENPDDPESQAKILEMIRQEQIEENMKLAYEITPESFAYVNMLYIDIVVNGHKVQAFVDSGAQTTIISPKLADEIGISRLIDRRFQGEARGVGSQRIEGKIHSVPISIGDSKVEIPCSFMVIDTQVDLLFGLDMLRRHKCVIDLDKDALIVGGNIETKFLHESEIKNTAFSNNPKSSSSSFGGNIFSDANDVMPANSTPTPKSGRKPASNAAGEAASKRQNTGQLDTESSSFKEEDIKQLINLGFSRQEAILALQQTNGNVELAASLLFQ